MKLIILLELCLIHVFSNVDINNKWEEWKTNNNRTYSNIIEEEKRYNIWNDNLIDINTHNVRNVSWKKGLNMFSDLTLEEFKQRISMKSSFDTSLCNKINNQTITDNLLFNVLSPILSRKLLQLRQLNKKILPAYWDWRVEGAVSPVKSQLNCGACYSFASISAIEGLSKITTGVLYDLSAQQIVDCSKPFGNDGCDGGTADQTFNYVKNNGLCMESDYPAYVGKVFPCSASTCRSVINISGCASLRTGDLKTTELMLEYMVNLQPVTVGVDATCLFSYVSGVIDDISCYKAIDHMMTIVGYSRVLSPIGYWILKNSWSTSFGEEGYVRISMNYNILGIAEIPSIPTSYIP